MPHAEFNAVRDEPWQGPFAPIEIGCGGRPYAHYYYTSLISALLRPKPLSNATSDAPPPGVVSRSFREHP
jgi:hypothetical protein